MINVLVFALAICSAPGPRQMCVMEERPPMIYQTIEDCRKDQAAAAKLNAITRCVSRAPTWTPVD